MLVVKITDITDKFQKIKSFQKNISNDQKYMWSICNCVILRNPSACLWLSFFAYIGVGDRIIMLISKKGDYMVKSKSGIALLKHNDTKVDTKVLDCNLRRFMMFNRPFRFVFDGKQWLAYSHFDKCTTDLNKALANTYMSGIYMVGKKAKALCYDKNLKTQLKDWLEFKTKTDNPKNVKAMKAKKRDLRKSDINSCHIFTMEGKRVDK